MNSRVAFPFLVLSEEAVEFGGWRVGTPGSPLPEAGDVLENWDYERDVEIACTLALNWALIAEDLQLPGEALKLKVVMSVGTGTGSIPRRQTRLVERILDSSVPGLDMVSTVPGNLLSGRLRLSLQLQLESPVMSGSVLSPREKGARLWRTDHDMLLEDGGDSRFPVELTSFSQAFRGQPQEQSPWYLHWNPAAYQSDFSGSVRLFINSDHESVATRFVEGDSATLQAIMGDVVSQMIESVLDEPDFPEIAKSCEEGSLGQQIQAWMNLAFPAQKFESIRSMRDLFPGRFRAAVLGATEFEEMAS